MSSQGLLVLDEDLDIAYPRHYRASLNSEHNSTLSADLKNGLPELHFMSSAQFSERTLKEVLKTIDQKIWLIDLRRESHGFINGVPISWYQKENKSNVGLSNDEVLKNEAATLATLKNQPTIFINKILEKNEGTIDRTKGFSLENIQLIESEAQLAQRLHLGYLRIAVSDHHRPADKDVDEFVAFVKNLPANDWLYLHCRGGKGRSSTFVMMFDILKNGKILSLAQISERQVILGSKDLLKLKDDPSTLWKKEAATGRKEFIAKFYDYVTAENGYPKQTWSQWLKNS